MEVIPETSRFFYVLILREKLMMYFCYIDESGTPEIPGTSSHYVLCGLAIPINKWKTCDSQIQVCITFRL